MLPLNQRGYAYLLLFNINEYITTAYFTECCLLNDKCTFG